MKILIVLAHPEQNSLNGHLAGLAQTTLLEQAYNVQISDLYASGFDPSEGPQHFSVRMNADCFDVQSEQRFSYQKRSLPAEVNKEIEKLFWADLVLFQFPLWWFGPPAILKGWMDRVFVYGALYSSSRRHDSGPCRGKKAFVSVTAGSSESVCTYNGREGDTRLILWPFLYALRYVGFTVLEPFVIYGATRPLKRRNRTLQKASLLDREQQYKECILNIHDRQILPFNSDEDWDENGKLRAEAPAYSPFIRHKQVLDLV